MITGDIRNILKTVGDQLPRTRQWQLTTRPEKLRFVVNDVDDVLLARNAILLELCQELDSNCHKDMVFFWSVWYNAELSKNAFARLKGLISKLITNIENNDSSSIWTFGNEDTKRAVLRVWKDWVGRKFDTKEIKDNREQIERIGLDELNRQYFIANELNKNVDQLFKQESREWKQTGIYIPKNGAQSKKERRAERKRGQTMERVINPTMMRPGSNIWSLHYSSDPASSHIPFDV